MRQLGCYPGTIVVSSNSKTAGGRFSLLLHQQSFVGTGFLNSAVKNEKTNGKNANGYNRLTNRTQKRGSPTRYVGRLSQLVIQDSKSKKESKQGPEVARLNK
jgi:hypothetical protein